MFALFGWLFLHTSSASESTWIRIPFTPIKWKLQLYFTVSAFSILNFRRDNKFYDILFKLINCWINIFQMILKLLNNFSIVFINWQFQRERLAVIFSFSYRCFTVSFQWKQIQFTEFFLENFFWKFLFQLFKFLTLVDDIFR